MDNQKNSLDAIIMQLNMMTPATAENAHNNGDKRIHSWINDPNAKLVIRTCLD